MGTMHRTDDAKKALHELSTVRGIENLKSDVPHIEVLYLEPCLAPPPPRLDEADARRNMSLQTLSVQKPCNLRYFTLYKELRKPKEAYDMIIGCRKACGS